MKVDLFSMQLHGHARARATKALAEDLATLGVTLDMYCMLPGEPGVAHRTAEVLLLASRHASPPPGVPNTELPVLEVRAASWDPPVTESQLDLDYAAEWHRYRARMFRETGR